MAEFKSCTRLQSTGSMPSPGSQPAPVRKLPAGHRKLPYNHPQAPRKPLPHLILSTQKHLRCAILYTEGRSNQMPRPRNPKPRHRDQALSLKVTEEEKQLIASRAASSHRSITDYIVLLIQRDQRDKEEALHHAESEEP